MNRVDFMKRLSELLSEIAPAEREEAIQYYNNYFDDAGEENEASVISELGSPEQVAETIKAEFYGKPQDEWEFTEAGCTNTGTRKNAAVATVNRNQENRQNGYGASYSQAYQNTAPKKQGTDVGKIIMIILLLIVTSPLWLSIAGTLFGFAVALLAILFAFFIAFIVVTLAFIVCGIVLFFLSFPKMMISPLLGITTLGVGLVFTGLGLLFLVFSLWICAKAIPATFRFFVNICRRPFQRKGGQMA